MNQKKEEETMTLTVTRKHCSRIEEHHVTRNSSVATHRKSGAHSGLRFNSDQKKKLTVVKPFSFDTGPKKVEKGNLSLSLEKSAGKKTNGEQKRKGAGGQVKIITESANFAKETLSSVMRTRSRSTNIPAESHHVKVVTESGSLAKETQSGKIRPGSVERASKSPTGSQVNTKTEKAGFARDTESSKMRSISRERTLASPVDDDAGEKKPRSRSPGAAKPQAQPSKAANSPVPKLKYQAQASNASKSQGKALKVPKSQTQPSNIVKPQVHFSHAEKPEMDTCNAKECDSSKSEKPRSASEISDMKNSASVTSNAEMAETKLQNGLETKPTNETHSLNGSVKHLECDSSNESESEYSNGINLECELSNACKNFVSGIPKSASKIPRKKYGLHSGIQFQTHVKKETVSQSFSFENRCSNLKKETTSMSSEANQVQITSMVHN